MFEAVLLNDLSINFAYVWVQITWISQGEVFSALQLPLGYFTKSVDLPFI